MAADIGTTGVALALLDLSDGSAVARRGFLNPQRALGADVISRISAAVNGRAEELRQLITQGVARGARELLASANASPERVRRVTVAANTVMAHLLLGLPCGSLGVYPFTPAPMPNAAIDFEGVFGTGTGINCPVRVIPWLGAYIGGDVTAGIAYVLHARKSGRFMLIDLGTNSELALYDGGAVRAASAAAGPAFGAGSASRAVSELAQMIRGGLVDETGLLRERASGALTQEEIRGIQLAKSAVRAGVEILTDGVPPPDAVYLAGGMGQSLDVNDAADIGLLPFPLSEKARAIGNAALGGAARMLFEPYPNIETLNFTEVTLSAHPRFEELFMEHLRFPPNRPPRSSC